MFSTEPAMHIDGQCHCGAIAWEAEVDPDKASVCHCTDCQSFSGSPFRASVPAKAEDFRFTRGAPRIYVKTADSGNPRAQAFCGDCGSPIWSGAPENSPVYMLRLGAVRQRAEITPRRQIWCASAVPWAQDVSGLPGTPKD
jgi:hypothetical protein